MIFSLVGGSLANADTQMETCSVKEEKPCSDPLPPKDKVLAPGTQANADPLLKKEVKDEKAPTEPSKSENKKAKRESNSKAHPH